MFEENARSGDDQNTHVSILQGLNWNCVKKRDEDTLNLNFSLRSFSDCIHNSL